MVGERLERRLSAILAADVVAYSRLTGADEEGTRSQLQDHLRSLVDPKIAEHRGRMVKNTGDGMLAEFGSVVDAMRCAADIQRGMLERNANVPQEKRIEFRIGINVGHIKSLQAIIPERCEGIECNGMGSRGADISRHKWVVSGRYRARWLPGPTNRKNGLEVQRQP